MTITQRSKRPPAFRERLAMASLAAAMVFAAACSDASSTTTAAPANQAPTAAEAGLTTAPATTEATTTTEAATTTEPTTTILEGKTPAATIDDLTNQIYAAVNAKDTVAYRALCADGTSEYLYTSDGVSGNLIWQRATSQWTLETDPYRSVEILGEPIVSGPVVAVPSRLSYADTSYVGFDVFKVIQMPGGFLRGSIVHFMGDQGPEAGLIGYMTVIDVQRAAWNAGDAAGVLATMSDQAVFWENATDPDTRHTGDALADFVAGSMWFDVEMTGPPLFSGLFAALPTRLFTASDSSEGITVFWIKDGTIALQAFQQ